MKNEGRKKRGRKKYGPRTGNSGSADALSAAAQPHTPLKLFLWFNLVSTRTAFTNPPTKPQRRKAAVSSGQLVRMQTRAFCWVRTQGVGACTTSYFLKKVGLTYYTIQGHLSYHKRVTEVLSQNPLYLFPASLFSISDCFCS